MNLSTEGRKAFKELMNKMAEHYGESAHWNGTDKFSVDPVAPKVEQTLEKHIREKNDLMGKINVIGVRDLTGEKLGMSVSQRIASRTDTDVKDRQTKHIGDVDGREYKLYKTDFDIHIKYQMVDHWSAYPNFKDLWRSLIVEQIGQDREVVGWYGEQAVDTTDLANNPNLEDLNRGWLQALREEKPANLLGSDGTPITIGAGGTYENLDLAVFDMKNNLLDPWHRNAGDLVLILGDELHTKYHASLMADNLSPASERNAREAWLKRNTIGSLPVHKLNHFPERGILITSWKNLSIYYQRGSRRRTIVDNAKRDRIEDYMSTNEGYVIEDYGKICGIDFKSLQLV